MDLPRALSHSQMSTYERCPQKWKLQYVDGRREPPAAPLNFGSAVHAGLEACYGKRVAEPAPLEEMLAAFEEELDPAAYDEEEDLERYRADGRALLRAFRERHAEEFRPALFVERRLRTEIAGERVVAVLDRVDRVDGPGGEPRLRVVDYKTGRAWTMERVRTDPQLTLYQMAAERELGLEVASLALYHVPTQTPFEVGRHPEEREDRLRERVRSVAAGIRREAFEPNPGAHCEWCGVKPWCPAFADAFPENWQQEPTPPAPTHTEAAALADRYGELRARAAELRSEAEEVRSRLEAFFRETGERAVRGQRYRVTASRSTGYRFDDDAELREVLEPLGLWEKVLKPNWRLQADLLEDPEVPEEVRERLREIGREKVTWRLYRREVADGEE